MGTYVDENLEKDEVVRYAARISLWRYWLRFVLGSLLLLGSLPAVITSLLMPSANPAAAAGLGASMGLMGIVGVVLLAWPFVARRFTEVVVTNRQLIAKHGVLSRHSIEIRFAKIEAVRVRQGILGRMLGFGDIVVTGTGSTFDPIKSIANPMGFRSALSQAMEAAAKS